MFRRWRHRTELDGRRVSPAKRPTAANPVHLSVDAAARIGRVRIENGSGQSGDAVPGSPPIQRFRGRGSDHIDVGRIGIRKSGSPDDSRKRQAAEEAEPSDCARTFGPGKQTEYLFHFRFKGYSRNIIMMPKFVIYFARKVFNLTFKVYFISFIISLKLHSLGSPIIHFLRWGFKQWRELNSVLSSLMSGYYYTFCSFILWHFFLLILSYVFTPFMIMYAA